MYSESIARKYSINYNPNVHGTAGPVQVSYPKYFYPQSSKRPALRIKAVLIVLILVNLFDGLNYLGVPTEFDPNDGSSAGAAFVPTDLDPNNQTRSDARRAYFDPYTGRDNFHVITGQHVTRILIDHVSGSRAGNPMPGGNSNGDGPDTNSSQGLGFSPVEIKQPPVGQERKRRDANLLNLKILGVEVISVPLRLYGVANPK